MWIISDGGGFKFQTIRECLEGCKICLYLIQSKSQINLYKLNWSFLKENCYVDRYGYHTAAHWCYRLSDDGRDHNGSEIAITFLCWAKMRKCQYISVL